MDHRRRDPFLLVGIALGLVLIAVIVTIAVSRSEPAPVSLPPPEIERLIPRPGDQILRQGEVGADVLQGWAFQLSVDGVVIPTDQLVKVEPLGLFTYLPRPGKLVETWTTGEHTARVELTAPDASRTVTYEWQFRVGA